MTLWHVWARRFAVASISGTACSLPAEDGGAIDGSTGSAPDTTSATQIDSATEGSTAVDDSTATTDSPETCDVAGENVETWQWNFGEHVPLSDPEAMAYAEDALAVLECDVVDGAGDPSSVTLTLACASAGADLPPMDLAIAPAHAIVLDALAADSSLSLAFRPGNDCPNGCSPEGGWLALRTEPAGELLLGLVDVHRELDPVAELMTPVAVSVTPSACEPTVIGECELQDDVLAALDVTVTAATDSVTLRAGEHAELGAFDVTVERATVGMLTCVDDGGDPSHIDVAVVRRALP